MKDIGSYVLFVMDYSSWMGITDLFLCLNMKCEVEISHSQTLKSEAFCLLM